LAALRGFAPGNDQRLGTRAGLLRVDAFRASGQQDSALLTIQQLRQQYPDNARIKARADSMSAAAPPAPTPAAPPAVDSTTTRN
jgi:glutamyl/glutaminyl-tRNA synthetase